MTDAVTAITYPSATFGQMATAELSHTTVFVGGAAVDPGSGITQAEADARYIRLNAINAASGVGGLDASSFLAEAQLPLPPVDLTIWFENQLA